MYIPLKLPLDDNSEATPLYKDMSYAALVKIKSLKKKPTQNQV